ncbi:hypothetical protein ACJO3M_16190 [Marinobacter sp. HN1S83]
MSCICASKNQYLELHPDEELPQFIDSLTKFEESGDYGLFECPSCHQLWIIDIHSRGPLAVKVQSESEFLKFDDVQYRKDLMVQLQGGLSGELCIQSGCEKNALNGLRFCIDHAMEW